MQAREISKMNL